MSDSLDPQAPEAPTVKLCEALTKGRSLEELVKLARWRRGEKRGKRQAEQEMRESENDDENEPKDE